MNKFLADHPEWGHEFVAPGIQPAYHEFRRVGERETVITDVSLGFALDRVEALVALEEEGGTP